MVKELIKEARTYLGVPWVHQGRSRKGVDCAGFILLTLWKFGIKANSMVGYSRKPDGVLLEKTMDEQPSMHKLPRGSKLSIGDILLFRIKRHPQHVALVTESKTSEFGMIHSYNGGQKKVVEHDLADYWKRKIVAVYRLNNE